MTFEKLRTSWVTPEKNGTLWNIFGHPTAGFGKSNIVKACPNIFGNTTYPANRTSLKKSIIGNPTNSTNRTSSVTFENLRKNPNDSEKSSTPREIYSHVDALRARHAFLPHERRNARRALAPYEPLRGRLKEIRLIRQMNHLR